MRNIVEGSKNKLIKMILVVFNILLIFTAVLSSLNYSNHVRNEKMQMEIDAFCSTMEGMKQVSANYLNMEKGYAENWASYIKSQNMDMQEALAYIRENNAQKDRYAHIVDMDTYEAYSTYEKNGDNSVGCYKEFRDGGNQTDQIFIKNMEQMFAADNEQINVLGKYKIKEAQVTVISVGTRVSLRTEGTGLDSSASEPGTRDYLLLRVIPVEKMKDIWVFPVEYTAAEVGMITKSGAYVIQSASMKSYNFLEFIRSYNFENDYNKVNELEEHLLSTNKGLLRYRNSRGEECYWYYSEFDDRSGIDIVGCITVSDLNPHDSNWMIVVIICGIVLLLVLIDGIYILTMNHKLKETAEMAEYANQAKTRFLSSMSHDIRTPMNAVIGMTDIARKYADDPKRVRESLDKVSLASNHLLTLINDILDISKVESGNMALNPSIFSIKDLTDKLVNIIQSQIEEKKLEFHVYAQDFRYEYLVADELRLNQIFLNLLNNAVKYTNAGGKIELSLVEEMIPEDSSQVRLICTVSDTGIGMSEEFQKNMYNSFERATDSRINKIQGSGLGLAIAKEMVELMDGSIECNSTPGKGTTFTVVLVLPVAYVPIQPKVSGVQQPSENVTQERIQNIPSKEMSPDRFKDIRLLIAEDNDLNWEIISELLGEYQIQCDRAEDGQKCVEMIFSAEEGKYDAIFMDVQMPVMNGKEAARTIRKSRIKYIRNIPIIAVTADAFAEDMKECIDAGMNAHISKPVDIKKVLDILQTIQDKKEREHE